MIFHLILSLFTLQEGSRAAASLDFFIEDTIKIFILLIVITQAMSFLRHYLPMEKIKRTLTSHRWYGLDYVLASLFGAVTPFCTCSSIPIFIGFLEAQIPLGVTFAFLITSPLVNEVAVSMLIGIFGLKVAMIYTISGILIGVVGGMILGKLKLERYVDSSLWELKKEKEEWGVKCGGRRDTRYARVWAVLGETSQEGWGIVRKVALYVLLGVGLGAIIHGYVPTGFFDSIFQAQNWWTVPAVVLIGVPMYSNATGVIPVVQSLIDKGVPLGTALAFMMAIVGLSLPEALILKRVMKLPLLLTFFGIVAAGMIGIGYLFNAVL